MAWNVGNGGGGASTALDFGSDGAIHVPSADFLYSASFVRSGSDLKLVGQDGHTILVPRYFDSGTPPPLIAPNDTVLNGDTVRLLAGPAHPGQYAQAGDAAAAPSPIGKVVQADGTINIQHADGTAGTLHLGDAIFENDVVETGASSVGIRFTDGSLFSMSAGTRMVINHFVYDADSSSNSALFSVIKGTFTMFGGKVVDSGHMEVSTPIATLGIRGSNSIGVNVDAPKGWLTTNATDPNGDLSKVEVIDPVTQQVITTLTDLFTKVILTPQGVGVLATTPEEIANAQKLAQLLHQIYTFKPPSAPDFEDPTVKKIFFDFDDDQNFSPLPANVLFIPYQALPSLSKAVTELQNPVITEVVAPQDDTPTISTTGTPPTLVVDDTTLGTNATQSVTANFNSAFGANGPGAVTYALGVVAGPSGLVDTLTHEAVILSLTAGGVVEGRTAETNQLVFTVTVDGSGNVTLDQIRALDHTPDSGPDQSTSLSAANLVTVTATITDSDGDPASSTLNIGQNLVFHDDAPTAVNDTAQSVAEDGAAIGGNVLANDARGSDGATLTHVDLGSGLVAIASGTGLSGGVYQFATANGTYTFTADGAWTFDPNTNLNNASDLSAGFAYQITDGDGDTATALQPIMVTDGTVAAVPAAITLEVDEAALSTTGATGSHPLLTTETDSAPSLTFTAGSDSLTSFAFSNSLAGLVTDLNGVDGQDIWWSRVSDTQIKGFLDQGLTQLAVTLDLSAPQTIAAGASGDVTVTMTLSDNLPHPTANGAQISSIGNVGVVATDTDGDVTTGTVNLTVKDDVPTAVNDTASVVQEGQDFNVAFVLDFSGSIDNTELNQMLNAVRAAGQALFNGTSGDVSIQLVAFSSTATSYGPFTTFESFSDQIAAINPEERGTRPFNGGTDFTAGIEATIATYVPVADSVNQIYFISDGNPTEQTGPNGQPLTETTAAAWNTFVNTFDIGVQTIGIGNGINNGPLQALEVDGDGAPILVADFTGLIDTLLDAATPSNVSGNVLTDQSVISGDAFGADGGHIQSITINGITYEWNGDNTITPSSGDPIAGHQLTNIPTDAGGKLSFDFTTGDWSYTSPTGGVTHDTTETFPYVLVDGDGDQAGANLEVTVTNLSETPTPVTLVDDTTTLYLKVLQDSWQGSSDLPHFQNFKIIVGGVTYTLGESPELTIVSSNFYSGTGDQFTLGAGTGSGGVDRYVVFAITGVPESTSPTSVEIAFDYSVNPIQGDTQHDGIQFFIGTNEATQDTVIYDGDQDPAFTGTDDNLIASPRQLSFDYSFSGGEISVSNQLLAFAADPIVLDLGSSGIAFSSVMDGVQFDINADGLLDQVAWTAGDDGILAYDLDGSGKIESGAEMFTPHFAGGSYADGLAALASLDSNHDGVIDGSDAAYDKLVVWQDVNHDGVSDAGEMKSLAQLGISSIDLGAQLKQIYIDGQVIVAEGSFTYTDGSAGSFVEVNFDAALGNTEAANDDAYDGVLDAERETDSRNTNAAALAASVGFGVATAAASAVAADPLHLDDTSAAVPSNDSGTIGAASALPEAGPDGDAPVVDPLHGTPGDETTPDATSSTSSDAPSTQGLAPVDSDATPSPIESLTPAPADSDEHPATITTPDGQPAHPEAASAAGHPSPPSSGASFEESKAEPLPEVKSLVDHDTPPVTANGVPASAPVVSLAERLTALDTNHDGLVDANDANFSKLTVWQDTNHDGVADADELSSLADHGINGISLNGVSIEGYLDAQSLLAQTASGEPLVAVQGSDAQFAKLASLDIGDLLLGGERYIDLDQALKDSPLTSSQSDGASANGAAPSEAQPGASSSEAAQLQADAPAPSVDSGAAQGSSGTPAQQTPSQSQAAQANDGPAEAAGPNHADAAAVTIHVDDGAEQAQNHAVA